MSADKRTLQNRQFAGNRFSALIFNALVLLAGLILLFPLFWIVITAMKGQMDVLKHPLAVIPQEFMLLENLETVLERAPWGTFALNTGACCGWCSACTAGGQHSRCICVCIHALFPETGAVSVLDCTSPGYGGIAAPSQLSHNQSSRTL